MAIITISRGTFSGGKELAECIADKLGYKCLSREVLVEAARRYDVSLEKLSQAMEGKPGILERMTLDRVHYLAYVRAALAKAAGDEKLVYHGHAGHLLLGGVPHVLKVRVIADVEYRIKAAMARRNLNRQQAIDFIKKIDDDRRKWTKFLYHVDLFDPSLYDVIINVEKIKMPHACEMLTLLSQSEEFQPTPQSQKSIADLILSTDVRARIAADGSVRDDEVEVEADGGMVAITGSVNSLQDAEKLKEIVQKCPGVQGVVSRIKPTYHSMVRY
ncbi:MAG: cytidylate kinase family protein [Dehalococcoidia bacterium]